MVISVLEKKKGGAIGVKVKDRKCFFPTGLFDIYWRQSSQT